MHGVRENWTADRLGQNCRTPHLPCILGMSHGSGDGVASLLDRLSPTSWEAEETLAAWWAPFDAEMHR